MANFCEEECKLGGVHALEKNVKNFSGPHDTDQIGQSF